jgi:pimeloyl-ACP methyl ester carboxylesterase
LALVQTLQLERYVLIGHSMGGKLVQLMASANPTGLVGTVLVAPAPPNPQILPLEALEVQKHAYDNPENVAGAIAFLTQRPLSETLRKRVIEDSLRGSVAGKYGWPNEMQLEDIAGAAESIRVPTLVLAGQSDRERPISAQTAEVVYRIPGAELAVIPDAGHLLPLEAPGEVADAIQSFLGKHLHSQPATAHGSS